MVFAVHLVDIYDLKGIFKEDGVEDSKSEKTGKKPNKDGRLKRWMKKQWLAKVRKSCYKRWAERFSPGKNIPLEG